VIVRPDGRHRGRGHSEFTAARFDAAGVTLTRRTRGLRWGGDLEYATNDPGASHGGRRSLDDVDAWVSARAGLCCSTWTAS